MKDINNSDSPAVSVYMPTHNRLSLLRRAIASLQKQTFTDFEVIVVDDGSSDGTPEYLESLTQSDSRFRFFRHETPQGACVARNLAIQHARAKYVTGLDDDDEFLPNRLEYFVNSPIDNYAFVFAPQYWNYGRVRTVLGYAGKLLKPNQLLSLNHVGNQVFVDKQKLLRAGGFDPLMPACQDWDTWIRLSQKFGDALNLDEPTYVTHVDHENNRITVSENKVIGHQKILTKFESISTSQNQKSQRFLMLAAKKERLSLTQLVQLITSENAKLVLRYYFASHLPWIANLRLSLLRG